MNGRTQILVGVTMRIVKASAYHELRDCIAQDWWSFFAEVLPDTQFVLIPNLGRHAAEYVESLGVQAVLLTGGNDIGEFPQRDATELAVLDYAIQNSLPVLGVCRGMQLIQSHLGGRVSKCPGTHVAKSHSVTISANSRLHDADAEVVVNSYHNYGIERKELAGELVPFAISDDDLVEGFIHQSEMITGIQWHPERDTPFRELDTKICRRALGLPALLRQGDDARMNSLQLHKTL